MQHFFVFFATGIIFSIFQIFDILKFGKKSGGGKVRARQNHLPTSVGTMLYPKIYLAGWNRDLIIYLAFGDTIPYTYVVWMGYPTTLVTKGYGSLFRFSRFFFCGSFILNLGMSLGGVDCGLTMLYPKIYVAGWGRHLIIYRSCRDAFSYTYHPLT